MMQLKADQLKIAQKFGKCLKVGALPPIEAEILFVLPLQGCNPVRVIQKDCSESGNTAGKMPERVGAEKGKKAVQMIYLYNNFSV